MKFEIKSIGNGVILEADDGDEDLCWQESYDDDARDYVELARQLLEAVERL